MRTERIKLGKKRLLLSKNSEVYRLWSFELMLMHAEKINKYYGNNVAPRQACNMVNKTQQNLLVKKDVFSVLTGFVGALSVFIATDNSK